MWVLTSICGFWIGFASLFDAYKHSKVKETIILASTLFIFLLFLSPMVIYLCEITRIYEAFILKIVDEMIIYGVGIEKDFDSFSEENIPWNFSNFKEKSTFLNVNISNNMEEMKGIRAKPSLSVAVERNKSKLNLKTYFALRYIVRKKKLCFELFGYVVSYKNVSKTALYFLAIRSLTYVLYFVVNN